MTDYVGLRVLRHDAVAEIELCRPDLLNRIDETVHIELTEVLGALDADSRVRAVVLTSTGPAFSAGGDTDTMLEAAGDLARRVAMMDEGRRLFRALADFPKPFVVALHGDTYGLGASITLLADGVVSIPTVRIADTHVLMGLVSGDGGCVAWPLNFGIVKSKRHLLTGDPITGEEAFRLGVVSDLVEDVSQVRPAALALGERMASLPPLAVQLTKRALNKFIGVHAESVLDYSIFLEALTFGSDDLQEAVTAFHEKRSGRWSGR